MANLVIIALISIVVGGAVLVLFSYLDKQKKSNDTELADKKLLNQKKSEAKGLKEKNQKKSDKINHKHLATSVPKSKYANSTEKKDHVLFFKEVGGHTAPATCIAFSANNGLVASCSIDGTVRCMPFADVGAANAHEVYASFEGVPTAVTFTQNSRRVVVAVDGLLKYYSISITPESKKLDHVKDLKSGLRTINSIHLLDVEHWMTIIACGVDENGEPCIRAFDHKGSRISNLVQTKRKGRADKHRPPLPKKALAVAAPDDRFVALYGVGEAEGLGDGEVGIFQVVRDSASETSTGLKLSFVLAGHECDVIAMAWNVTGKRLVTCCENGVWRLWDTTVRYNEAEQPRLFSGHQTVPNGAVPDGVGLMKGGLVVVSCGRDMYFCAAGSGEVVEQIENACVQPIRAIRVTVDGTKVATVVDNAKRICLWSAPSMPSAS